VGDGYGNNIYEFTPAGVSTTFASGLDLPFSLVFNNEGNLFVSEIKSDSITEILPDGVQSTFASGPYVPYGLAMEGEILPVPEPSALGLLAVGFGVLLVRQRRILSAK